MIEGYLNAHSTAQSVIDGRKFVADRLFGVMQVLAGADHDRVISSLVLQGRDLAQFLLLFRGGSHEHQVPLLLPIKINPESARLVPFRIAPLSIFAPHLESFLIQAHV